MALYVVLVSGTVNEVSCETLNKDKGEEEMKKNVLIGGLIVLLMSGLFIGCPDKPEEEKGNSHNGLKVAEEYRGDWYDNGGSLRFQLTSSELIRWVSGSKGSSYPAWTVNNEGVVELWTYSSSKDTKYGTFTDTSTLVYTDGNITWVKK